MTMEERVAAVVDEIILSSEPRSLYYTREEMIDMVYSCLMNVSRKCPEEITSKPERT